MGSGTKLRLDLIVNDDGSVTLNKFSKNTHRHMRDAARGVETFSGSVKKLTGLLGGLAGAWGLKELAGNFLQAGLQVEKTELILKTATGSIEKAGQAQQFLRSESERLGLVFRDQADGFAQLAAAAKGTTLEGEKVQNVWLGVTEAMRALNADKDTFEGALTAITQMMSKGTVSAEELTGQLGERLPGALPRAARAMGVTVAEFRKMQEQGEVLAEDFLPKFAAQLRKEFSGGAEEAAKKVGGQWSRMTNIFHDFQKEAMAGGGMEAVAGGLREILSLAKQLQEDGTLTAWAQGMGTALSDATKWVREHKTEIAAVWDLTKTVLGAIKDVVAMVYQGWYELGQLMANFLVDSHYEDIQKIFDSMGTMAAGFADAFKEAWGAIPAFFEGVFSTVENIWNKIKEIIDKVKGVKDQISGWFGKDGDSGKMDFSGQVFRVRIVRKAHHRKAE